MIITDQKLLRLPCSDVSPDEVAIIKEALEGELRHSAEIGREGIGLSAPQIGIYKNMAIVRIPTRGGLISVDLVNCKIRAGYDKAFFEREGCLSFPDTYKKTSRFQEIHIVDNVVEPHCFIATGLTAVCVAHELDHLNGILLPDLV